MFFLVAVLLAADTSPPETAPEELAASGRCDQALAALDELLGSPAAESLEAGERLRLRKLRASCLFELGDYAGCEKEIREILSGGAGLRKAEQVEWLAHLARAQTMQDVHDEAIGTVGKALEIDNAPELHRLAVTVLLRAGRFADILPHADALLEADDSDPFAHFVRGIAFARSDRFEDARRELPWGLEIPGAKRDAHFELALVLGKLREPEPALEHLLEILADDPYDQEACYQATQQLARTGTSAGKEAAAQLRRYFVSFSDARGETARHFPLQAAGLAPLAALTRAEEWKRLHVYDRMLEEIRRAQAVARDDPEPFLYEVDFWASAGLLTEAESVLSRLESRPHILPEDASERIRKLRGALAAAMERMRAQADDPLGKALLELAETSWQEARPRLETALSRAIAAARLPLADR
ncbi:MAG: hypothetical protein JXA90_09590, partial [Planctomycetes bacterium]|nr:hypothetical protein [Planctomycetota bacterium]